MRCQVHNRGGSVKLSKSFLESFSDFFTKEKIEKIKKNNSGIFIQNNFQNDLSAHPEKQAG